MMTSTATMKTSGTADSGPTILRNVTVPSEPSHPSAVSVVAPTSTKKKNTPGTNPFTRTMAVANPARTPFLVRRKP